MSFSKYATFGSEQDNFNAQFTWDCAFTGKRIVSCNPHLEMVSCLYNFGVAQMRQACYMPLEGNGIKLACKYFQQSASVFNQLT